MLGQRLSVLAASAAVAFALVPRQIATAASHERGGVSEAALCEAAIVSTSRQTGVPLPLLRALAPAESGIATVAGRPIAWPWTLNTNGYGSFHFRSRTAAEGHLRTLLAGGVDNVDIGCMQINWHWHHTAFASPAAALDPALNVRYAAVLLKSYRAEGRSWANAVGLYHSRNVSLAADYLCRVARQVRPIGAISGCKPSR